MSLIESLQAVVDPRRPQGQRYSSISLLLIIILSMLRNKHGYREIGRFCQINKSVFLELFRFKNGQVPSHVSIRSFIRETDFSSVQAAFHKWTQSYVDIEAGEWIAIDGKSIRSSMSDYSSEYQNFVSLVSLFSRRREQVLHVQKLENKQGNEAQTVEDLLEILDLQDVIFTMDALHCKKNATQNRNQGQSLCCESKEKSTQTLCCS